MSVNSNMVEKPRDLGRQVLAGAGWSLAGRFAVAGLGLVTGVVLTRLLPAEQMGTYLLASSLVMFAAVVANAGVNQVCVRYVAEHLARGEGGLARGALHVLLRLGLVCAVVSAVTFAGLIGVLGKTIYGDSGLAPLSVLLGAWVLVTAVQTLVTDGFRSLADIRAASVYGGPLTSALAVGGLLAVLAWGGDLTVTGALLLLVSAAAVNSGRGAWALRRSVLVLPESRLAVERLRVIRVFAVSLPLVLTTALLVVLVSVDLWVLGASLPADDLAAYGVAARTATLVGVPLLVVYGVLPPFVAGLYASGDTVRLERVLQTTAMVATVPAGILAAAFIVAGGPLLSLVYGEHYRSGAFPLAVLSMGQLVTVAAGACGLVLAMTGHQRALLRITAVTVVISVGILLLAVPVWGSQAAALVAAGGFATNSIAMAVAVRRLTGLSTTASVAATTRAVREVLR